MTDVYYTLMPPQMDFFDEKAVPESHILLQQWNYDFIYFFPKWESTHRAAVPLTNNVSDWSCTVP